MSASLVSDDPELGLVRLCRGCGEMWPLDAEFWYFQHGRAYGRCRACWSERVRDERGGQRFADPLVQAMA